MQRQETVCQLGPGSATREEAEAGYFSSSAKCFEAQIRSPIISLHRQALEGTELDGTQAVGKDLGLLPPLCSPDVHEHRPQPAGAATGAQHPCAPTLHPRLLWAEENIAS